MDTIIAEGLSGREVADLLGITPETFYRKREKLEADGFPSRIPALAKWSRPAIMEWLKRNGEQSKATQVEDESNPLDARFARRAS